MIGFEFLQNAFFISLGIICFSIAALFVIAAVRHIVKGDRKSGKQ